MASNLRELRERRNSVATTKKITRAMELIASSRIIKAQNTVKAASPYSLELTRALSAAAAHTHEDHPLTSINQTPSGLQFWSSPRIVAWLAPTRRMRSGPLRS